MPVDIIGLLDPAMPEAWLPQTFQRNKAVNVPLDEAKLDFYQGWSHPLFINGVHSNRL